MKLHMAIWLIRQRMQIDGIIRLGEAFRRRVD